MSTLPEIVIREYDSETGALVSNMSALAFGRVTKGAHSRVKVVDISFTNITSVGNLQLGLIGNAGVNVSASDAGVVYDDGSVANGYFGIQSSIEFDATIASQPLVRHFPGINDTAIADNINNVTVGARTNSLSNYIYLDIQVGSSGTGLRSGAYKIFFDFT